MDVSKEHNKDLGELMVDSVDFQGVHALMKQLLKDSCRSINETLTKIFQQCSSMEPNLLNRDEFEGFMTIMVNVADADKVLSTPTVVEARRDSLFQAKEQSLGVLGPEYIRRSTSTDEFKIANTLRDSVKFSAKNWSLLYCGGSAAVLDEIKKYRGKFGIGLAVEKFDW